MLGHLKGGFDAWLRAGKEADTVNRVSAQAFAENVDIEKDQIIDVRKESEFGAEHVKNAINKPLAYINEWINDIDRAYFFLHCAGGYRSMTAASILQARGYRNFTEVAGGFGEISKTGIPKVDFACTAGNKKV